MTPERGRIKVSAATAASTTAMTTRSGGSRRGIFTGSHDAETSSDDASDGLACLGVMSERHVAHALLNFVSANRLVRIAGNRFVSVGGHGSKIRAGVFPRKRFYQSRNRNVPIEESEWRDPAASASFLPLN